eukprot:6201744-Pleurochrysis_carterae.AAC.1
MSGKRCALPPQPPSCPRRTPAHPHTSTHLKAEYTNSICLVTYILAQSRGAHETGKGYATCMHLVNIP